MIQNKLITRRLINNKGNQFFLAKLEYFAIIYLMFFCFKWLVPKINFCQYEVINTIPSKIKLVIIKEM